jgi:hypothetical protein
MARTSRETRVINQIIKAHGSTIDLKAQPEVFVEIVRKWGVDLAEEIPDAGVRPGGVGPVGPTSIQFGPGIEDVMKEVLKLQRQMSKLMQRLDG